MNTKEKNIAFEGLCAFAISTGKTDVKGGSHFLTIDNKVYSFSNGFAKLLFKLLPNRVQKANEVWTSK